MVAIATVMATPQFSILECLDTGPYAYSDSNEYNSVPRLSVRGRPVKMNNVQGGRVWLFMEEKVMFGLDFIFQVVGAACAKAPWLVRGNTNSSMWLEQKAVSGGDRWGEWLEIKRNLRPDLAQPEEPSSYRLWAVREED